MSRNRIALPPHALAGWLFNRVVLEPGSLVMERRMLTGIKERAEWTAPVAHAHPGGQGDNWRS